MLNVPDNGNVYYPGDVQQSGGGYDARSIWPKHEFDPNNYGEQVQVWNFGDGGILTLRYKGLSPQEVAEQAAAKAKAELRARLAAAQAAALAVGPPVIACAQHEGPYDGSRGDFWRNMCSTAYCGNSPESWVRGNASYDRASGQFVWQLQLETDDTWAGPVGHIHLELLDNNGALLAQDDSSTQEMGGKHPGKARISNSNGYKNVALSVPANAATVTVRASCDGSKNAPFGIDPAVVLKVAQEVITALGGGDGQPKTDPPSNE